MTDIDMAIPSYLRDEYYKNRRDPHWNPPEKLANKIRWCPGCKQWKTLYRGFEVHKITSDGVKHYRKRCNACLKKVAAGPVPLDVAPPTTRLQLTGIDVVTGRERVLKPGKPVPASKPMPLFDDIDMLHESGVKMFIEACVRYGKKNVIDWLNEKFEDSLPGMLDNV